MRKQVKIVLSIVLLLSFGRIWAGTGPSHGVDPEVDNIEKVIADALDIRMDYIVAEKSKTYSFNTLDINLHEEFRIANEVDDLTDIFRYQKDYIKNEKVQKAIAAVEGLGTENLIEKLTQFDLVKLPLGIVKTFGSTTYSIVFDQAKIFTTYAEVRVYGRIKNEKVDLCFGAEDIKISFEGGIIGDATLALFGDFAVPLKSKKIGVVFNRFQGQSSGEKSGSFLTFDCDGFVEAGLDVDIVLSRDWVLPTDQNGKIIGGDARVVGNTVAKVRNFDDFVAEASMPYFTLTQDTSVSILLSRATFDYSEVNNAVGFQHPKVYDFDAGEFLSLPPEEEIPLWRGFYIEKIEFALPHVFKTPDDQPLIVGADRVYIDERGVSAYIYGDGLIPIETGTIGESGWAFALDHVGVQINYNRVLNFDFEGRINIPVNKEEQRLNYAAWGIPSENHYNITVGLDSTMSFPVFKAAEVRLTKGSQVFVDVKEGDFVPGATLCGGMYVSIIGGNSNENDDSKVNLDMPGVEFQLLMIRDTLPYIHLHENGGSITLVDPPILNNSPITIDHLSLTRSGEKNVKLGFGVEVSAMGSKEGGGKTDGTFAILAEYKELDGKNKWTYAGVEVNSMNIEIVMGTYLWVKGGLELYEGDSIYGNGFYGYLAGGVLAQGVEQGDEIGENNEYKVRMQASARFGTINQGKDDEYKYWFYDVYVSSSDKLFDIYTPVVAKGIGGGVYHHMRMAGYDIKEMASGAGSNPYSGIKYAPDAGTLFGIKFSLGIGITGVDGFKGNVTLELAIDTSLALQNIMLYGNGEFASDKFKIDALSRMDDLALTQDKSTEKDSTSAASNNLNKITAAIMIYMDFENGFELQGNYGAFLNAADGKIEGRATVDMYLSKDRKHIYIGGYEGTTNFKGEKIEDSYVKLNIGGFTVSSTFYFCTGNDLPDPPGIPPSIANAFGVSPSQDNRDDVPQGLDDLAMGFAFGANLSMDFDIVVVKLIKFNFELLVGFDIAMLSNPSNSYCSVSNDNNHGINGWRAKGQIYTSLVTKMDFWVLDPVWFNPFRGGWKTFFNVDVKVLMTADVPSPSYFFITYKYRGLWGPKERTYEYGEKCGTVVLN